jgi:hypothetical protein
VKLLNRRVEAVLVADAERDAALFRFGDHLFRVGSGERHRFFDEGVLSRADAVQRNACMVAAFRRNGAAVDGQFAQHFMVVGVDGGLRTCRLIIIGSFLFGALRHRVADCNELHDILVGNGGGNVVLGDAAAADQCKTILFQFISPFLHWKLKFFAGKAGSPAPALKNSPALD